MVARIAAGRKEREFDPALKALRACVADARGDAKIDPIAAKRLKDMLDFTETIDGWSTQMLGVPRAKLAALIRLGARIVSLLPLGKAEVSRLASVEMRDELRSTR